jgi:molecular chaperone GrpE (heat shock protein)
MTKSVADPFAITEEPVPLRDADVAAGLDGAAMESAVNDLLGGLAQTRRALEDREKESRGDIQRLLLEIIEIGDAFDRIFAAAREKEGSIEPSARRWLSNFRVVQSLVVRLLSEHGVAEIETLDRRFDPQWHKAVDAVADPSHPDGTIAQTLRKGYVRGGVILRKTEVIIVRNDASSPPDEATDG